MDTQIYNYLYNSAVWCVERMDTFGIEEGEHNEDDAYLLAKDGETTFKCDLTYTVVEIDDSFSHEFGIQSDSHKEVIDIEVRNIEIDEEDLDELRNRLSKGELS